MLRSPTALEILYMKINKVVILIRSSQRVEEGRIIIVLSAAGTSPLKIGNIFTLRCTVCNSYSIIPSIVFIIY